MYVCVCMYFRTDVCVCLVDCSSIEKDKDRMRRPDPSLVICPC